MKYFKTKASRMATRYEITPEVFNKVTKHQHPFEQINPDKTIAQYGICPSCLNPIQLIGVAKKVKTMPYGKHTGKDVPGLPPWSLIKYRYCPFSIKGARREINDDEILPEITEDVIELYELLKNNFDRVVYVISKELDIRCTKNFWEAALQQFIKNEAYCYPWLTEANLPYIFVYHGMRHRNVYGQGFLVGSEIYESLKKHKNITFEPFVNTGNYMRLTNKDSYLNLQFRFTGHKQKAVTGEELKESMLFCIDDLLSGTTVKTIYQKKIEFNETYFMNIIKKYGSEGKRQQYLLDIAKRNMPPLQQE